MDAPAAPKERLTSRGMCSLMVKYKANTPAAGVTPCHRFTVLTVVGAQIGVTFSALILGISFYGL